MNELFRVGTVATAHGIKGALKVFPTTDDPARFKKLKKIYFSRKAEQAEALQEFTVSGAAFSGVFVLLSLAEITDRNQAELMRGGSLWIPRADALSLSENEFFLADFIGARVLSDKEEELGTVADIIQLSSNDVLEVRDAAGHELLIPVIRDCIVEMNAEEALIRVHLLEGIRS